MSLKPDPSVIKQLVDAAESLERVRVDLDVSESKCPTCGANRANNWEDTKHAKSLSAAISRIDSTVSALYDDKLSPMRDSDPVVYYRRANTVRKKLKKQHLIEPKKMKGEIWKDYGKDKEDES